MQARVDARKAARAGIAKDASQVESYRVSFQEQLQSNSPGSCHVSCFFAHLDQGIQMKIENLEKLKDQQQILTSEYKTIEDGVGTLQQEFNETIQFLSTRDVQQFQLV